MADQHGLDPSMLLANVHGRRSADVIGELAVALRTPVEQVILEFEAHDAADQDGVTALPGAVPTLQRLPPECWAVVTSGSAAVARARLRAAALPIPRRLITADDVAAGKPDPAPFQLGAELLGVPPSLCLAVEDAPRVCSAPPEQAAAPWPCSRLTRQGQLQGASVTVRDLTAVRLQPRR